MILHHLQTNPPGDVFHAFACVRKMFRTCLTSTALWPGRGSLSSALIYASSAKASPQPAEHRNAYVGVHPAVSHVSRHLPRKSFRRRVGWEGQHRANFEMVL